MLLPLMSDGKMQEPGEDSLSLGVGMHKVACMFSEENLGILHFVLLVIFERKALPRKKDEPHSFRVGNW
jgi:hypothetical protein